jgi:biotin operon repressor
MARVRVVDQIMGAMRAQGTPVSLVELERQLGHSRRALQMPISALKRSGLVREGSRTRYSLTPLARELSSTAPAPLKQRKLREQCFAAKLWRCLRRAGVVTIFDLLQLMEKPNGHNQATYILSLLVRGKYVVRLAKRLPGIRQGGGGHVRYRLIRNTGPKPPIWHPIRRELTDGNDGTITSIPRCPSKRQLP